MTKPRASLPDQKTAPQDQQFQPLQGYGAVLPSHDVALAATVAASSASSQNLAQQRQMLVLQMLSQANQRQATLPTQPIYSLNQPSMPWLAQLQLLQRSIATSPSPNSSLLDSLSHHTGGQQPSETSLFSELLQQATATTNQQPNTIQNLSSSVPGAHQRAPAALQQDLNRSLLHALLQAPARSSDLTQRITIDQLMTNWHQIAARPPQGRTDASLQQSLPRPPQFPANTDLQTLLSTARPQLATMQQAISSAPLQAAPNAGVRTVQRQVGEAKAVIPLETPRTCGMDLPSDKSQLSGYQIMIRQQLEFFASQQDDIDYSVQGRKKKAKLGQVGIRCRHCANIPLRQRGRGACYYPRTFDSIYQAAQNMATNHLHASCNQIPPEIRQQLCELRDRRDTARGGKRYWSDACQALNLVEDEQGLRFADTVIAYTTKST